MTHKLIEQLEALKTDSGTSRLSRYDDCNNAAVDQCIVLVREAFEGKETAAKTLLAQLEGHTLLPNKPTTEMLEAGYNSIQVSALDEVTWMHCNIIYQAMLKATQGADHE